MFILPLLHKLMQLISNPNRRSRINFLFDIGKRSNITSNVDDVKLWTRQLRILLVKLWMLIFFFVDGLFDGVDTLLGQLVAIDPDGFRLHVIIYLIYYLTQSFIPISISSTISTLGTSIHAFCLEMSWLSFILILNYLSHIILFHRLILSSVL